MGEKAGKTARQRQCGRREEKVRGQRHQSRARSQENHNQRSGPNRKCQPPKTREEAKLSRPRLQAETGEKLHAPRPIAAERSMREETEPQQEKAQAEPKRHQPQKAKGKSRQGQARRRRTNRAQTPQQLRIETPENQQAAGRGGSDPVDSWNSRGSRACPKEKWLAPRTDKLPP